MKNILVPVGSSKYAVNTLQYAIDFVQNFNAKIYVIQAYGVTKVAGNLKRMDDLLEEDSKHDLKSVISKVNTKGVEIMAKPIKGHIIDSIERVSKQLHIDLIIAKAKSLAITDEYYVGNIAGSIIKFTEIPTLIIPPMYKFKDIHTVLMTFKSGKIQNTALTKSLEDILETFKAKLNLLHVKTPRFLPSDLELSPKLESLKTTYEVTENATIFQGVLEHLNEIHPDMLCVIRRKRGFFSKLWEKNSIKKIDFESRIPLLVLKGIQE